MDPAKLAGAVRLWGDFQVEDRLRPISGETVRPFHRHESGRDQAVGPAEGFPVACLFQAVEIPVIEREAATTKRLAKSESGAGNQPGDAEGGGEAADPFGFAGAKGGRGAG